MKFYFLLTEMANKSHKNQYENLKMQTNLQEFKTKPN